MIKKLLKQLKKGSNNRKIIEENLDISSRLFDAIFKTALQKNYIKEITVNSNCENCPLSTTCKENSSQCNITKMYQLTSKGRNYLKQN